MIHSLTLTWWMANIIYIHIIRTNGMKGYVSVLIKLHTIIKHYLITKLKKSVWEIPCTPTTITVNSTLITDSAVIGNHISITIPQSQPTCGYILHIHIYIYIYTTTLMWAQRDPLKLYSMATASTAMVYGQYIPHASSHIRHQHLILPWPHNS